MKTPIYLDYAAATPLDPLVLEAMRPFFAEKFYNPSAPSRAARAVAQDIASARSKVAYWLGARPAEIVFTAGGTEANNLAIHGVMRQYPKGNIVVSAVEHDSVLEPAKQYDVRLAPVDKDGMIDLEALEKLIDENTVMVSVMYANNEIGTLQSLHDVASLVEKKNRERRTENRERVPLLFHADACQAAGYLDLHVSRLGVDLMTLNGGKIYGPKQSGALYVRAGVELKPQILGGKQERGLRSGTENVAGIIGFATALDLAQTSRQEEAGRLQKLQELFFEEITMALPQSIINGSRRKRLPNNVHVTIPGTNNERLLIALDQAEIIAAAGSACSASNEESSHVLKAIGLTDAEARASLRFSMGKPTTEEEVRRAMKILKQLVSL